MARVPLWGQHGLSRVMWDTWPESLIWAHAWEAWENKLWGGFIRGHLEDVTRGMSAARLVIGSVKKACGAMQQSWRARRVGEKWWSSQVQCKAPAEWPCHGGVRDWAQTKPEPGTKALRTVSPVQAFVGAKECAKLCACRNYLMIIYCIANVLAGLEHWFDCIAVVFSINVHYFPFKHVLSPLHVLHWSETSV